MDTGNGMGDGRGQGSQGYPKRLRRVVVESPYAGDRTKHMYYLDDCLRDSLLRGEAPFASHGLYPGGALDDDLDIECWLGMAAGNEWRHWAHATVVYTDLGISGGMRLGMDHAAKVGHPLEYRSLEKWVGQP